MVIFGNLILLFAMFVSANLALAWAELATFDVHGDKSSLAGLGAAFILMVMRWLLVAACWGWWRWCGMGACGRMARRATDRPRASRSLRHYGWPAPAIYTWSTRKRSSRVFRTVPLPPQIGFQCRSENPPGCFAVRHFTSS